MPLQRVTITGADSNTNIEQMAQFSALFPYVEWGILLSNSQQGSPRYPSKEWMKQLLQALPQSAHVSLHFCGQYVRSYTSGGNSILHDYPDLWAFAGRYQLNFHGQSMPSPASQVGLEYRLRRDYPKPCIFQLDGTENEQLFRESLSNKLNVMPLFDTSSGAGESPQWWPVAIFHEDGTATAERANLISHGYAGGLSPNNITRELPFIDRASCGANYWVDMETHVRSQIDGEDVLDMQKVGLVLSACQRFLYGQIQGLTV